MCTNVTSSRRYRLLCAGRNWLPTENEDTAAGTPFCVNIFIPGSPGLGPGHRPPFIRRPHQRAPDDMQLTNSSASSIVRDLLSFPRRCGMVRSSDAVRGLHWLRGIGGVGRRQPKLIRRDTQPLTTVATDENSMTPEAR